MGSPHSPAQRGADDHGDEPPIEEVLNTIGDAYARRVLAAISDEPRSAPELAEELDVSRVTVYRRLDALKEFDLIDERWVVAEHGHHYHEYRCTFDAAVVSVNDDRYDVRIYRTENLPDRFADFWSELGNHAVT